MTTDRDAGAAVPDADPLDELASALLDGEASPEEARRASDPAVAARLAVFRAVAARVGSPVDPPGDQARERAILAALAANEPDELAARRAARRLPVWLPAAAAVAAVVAGAGLLFASAGNGGDAETARDGADSVTTAAAEAFADDSTAGAGTGSAGAPGAATAELAVVHLGEFADAEALADALAAGAPAERAVSDEAEPRPAEACPPPAGEVVAVATAVLRGEPVTVYVLAEGAGRRWVAFGPGCGAVAEGELPR